MNDSPLDTLTRRGLAWSALPDAYHACRRILDGDGDGDGTAMAMARVISSSPTHARRVLMLINGSTFSDGPQIHTISRALNLFGMQRMHDLMLASCLEEALQGLVADTRISEFWARSLQVALGARAAAQACGLLDPERPFVQGLLVDLGALVMWHADPQAMRAVAAEAAALGMPLHLREKAHFGYDAADAAMSVARAWGLPIAIALALGGQNAPADAAPHHIEAALLNLGCALADCKAGQDPAALVPSATLQILGLDKVDLPDLHRASLEIPAWLPEALGLQPAQVTKKRR